MEEKREVQAQILQEDSEKNGKNKATKEEINHIIRMISPGTNFRAALEGIVHAKKGAIIVTEVEGISSILDGGFKINSRFTPQKIIELSKMDGAIVLSKDMKRITQANVMIYPDKRISTKETGTRHKTAERTAKMMNTLTVTVSERKNEMTIYYKNFKHILRNVNELLRKVNEQTQIIEKQRELFDFNVEKLTQMELRNYPNLKQASIVLQKGRLIEKMASNLKEIFVELGNEGIILKTRLKELTANVEKEINLVIKDYTKIDLKKSRTLINGLSYEELVDSENIIRSLSYENNNKIDKIKGWRILSKTSLEDSDIASLIKEFTSLGKTINSNVNLYENIINKEKSKIFKEEIDQIKRSYFS
ncbi:DNA integrity scanning diadenylate cyclase DisA [Candidatus Pacearchaeota archaeon]|nr:DNA integrity scanning diadenylate cyclase DisA [Candidatus Pacearchaeota archaeon]